MSDAWDVLRRRLGSLYLGSLYQLGPMSSACPDICPNICTVCRGPARPGYARCYQCVRHDLLGPGSLADAVAPVCYAVKGTAFAADLWRYKSFLEPSDAARTSMLALLLAFLHDHGACVWRHAGMPAPGRLAVVPTGCGRPGPHPLLELCAPYLRLPVTGLVIRPGEQGRDPNAHRFAAERTGPGASVLLLEDTWVSGASAMSAAAALKRAGARHVAVVVLGRHIDPADRLGGPLAARLAAAPYDRAKCAVHAPSAPASPSPSWS
ncbi:MAG: hypothetical protein ACRDNT_31370 [Streptosporangiaceae bacterium]